MALLAKKIGMVRNWPMPMNRSRVFTMQAMISEKVEKSAEARTISTVTPRMWPGSKLSLTPSRAAQT